MEAGSRHAAAEGAAAGTSAPAHGPLDVENALANWPAGGESVFNTLQIGPRCIFSAVEMMQSMALMGAPMGADPDFDFRQSLLELARGSGLGRRYFYFQNRGGSRSACSNPLCRARSACAAFATSRAACASCAVESLAALVLPVHCPLSANDAP